MSRRFGPSRTMLVVRGSAAALAIVIVAGALIAYGGGAFDRNPEVTAQVPAAAGLIVGNASVRYQGVQVGKLVHIDSGTDSSNVVMRIDRTQIGRIPDSVTIQLVPRTLFGDVYMDLVPAGSPSAGTLRAGDELTVDTSPDSVQLYRLYSQVTALMNRLQPEKLQTALTAISTALRGRGAKLGDTIDRITVASGTLEPLIDASLASTPELAQLTQAIQAASPDLLATISSATTLSQAALDNRDGVANFLTSTASLANAAGAVLQENQQRVITVVHNAEPVLSTVAGNTVGLSSTLDQLAPFGEAGAKVFVTGRFSITAVPSFADPLPYTSADCPRYPGMAGANCGQPSSPTGKPVPTPVRSAAAPAAYTPGMSNVVGGPNEKPALLDLQEIVMGGKPADSPGWGEPNPATTMMLAPLVRGTEVRIS